MSFEEREKLLVQGSKRSNSTRYLTIPMSSTLLIDGALSWSRRREIQEEIRRKARNRGVPIRDIVVSSCSSLSPNIVSVSSDMDSESDPLAGKRIEMPYTSLLKQIRERQERAELIRVVNKPFKDRCPKADSILENNRHRYNLIATIAGPNLPLPRPEDGTADPKDVRIAQRFLQYPDHLLPVEFFQLHYPNDYVLIDEEGKQSSFVTICAIWNTMMGTSLLATPWAMSQSGLLMGPLIAILTSLMATYSSYRILNGRTIVEKYEPIHEFSHLCGIVLGPWWERLSSFFSLLAVGGAAIVYWVLMTNFAYNNVVYIHDQILGNVTAEMMVVDNSSTGVYCPHPKNNNTSDYHLLYNSVDESSSYFEMIWNVYTTPLFLVFIMVPLLSIKNITIFTKINSIGTLTVFFLIGLVIYTGVNWGLHVELLDEGSPEYTPLFKWNFPSLTGMLALGLFIHNCIITITKNNRVQGNNSRDMTIAFLLVTITYLLVGIVFYITFPLSKDCLEDNFLNNFPPNNGLAVFARFLLLFQLMTVFPLIIFIFRNQASFMFFNILAPSFALNSLFNALLLVPCVLMAIFYPKIGTIIRFSGSLCGFFLIFFLPNLVHLAVDKGESERNELSTPTILFHTFLILYGLANFISQFFIS